jgi:hypothetical protein
LTDTAGRGSAVALHPTAGYRLGFVSLAATVIGFTAGLIAFVLYNLGNSRLQKPPPPPPPKPPPTLPPPPNPEVAELPELRGAEAITCPVRTAI